jgi:4-hydroxybenzoyl-CoA reductase subunit beta
VILPPFTLHRPQRLEEAMALVEESGGDFDWLAGGTDLLPNYKNRLNPKPHVISVNRIEGLDELSPGRLGSALTLHRLARDEGVRRDFPALADAAAQVASPLIVRSATLGGNVMLDTRCFYFNQSEPWRASKGYCMKCEGEVCLVVPQKEICYATYSGDLAPVLMVYDARLELLGPRGERQLPLRTFFRHDGIARHHKEGDELLTALTLPDPPQGMLSGYVKLRIRDAIDFPSLGIAMGVTVQEGKIADLRVATTALHTTPDYHGDLGLAGAPLGEESAAELARALTACSRPVRNLPLPPAYRKKMIGVLSRRLLEQLAGASASAPR